MEQNKGFQSAVCALPEVLRKQLDRLPEAFTDTIEQLRFRVGQPIAADTVNGLYYLLGNRVYPADTPARLTRLSVKDMETLFAALCRYSVHSYTAQLREGYITLPGGHRAGVCGTAGTENGQVRSVHRITSICLRIAKAVPGAADAVMERIDTVENGLLIAGVPGSGKTTLLRDLVRQLPEHALTEWGRIAVVDERSEICGVADGQPALDVGRCCDVLDGYPKSAGILIALRTLAPKWIVCDEIGSMDDVEAVLQGVNAGVRFVASVHAASKADCYARLQIRALLETGAFSDIVLLDPKEKGRILQWLRPGREDA